MKFLDWINDNLWLVVVALVLVFTLKCSTPQTTISLENKAEKIKTGQLLIKFVML